MGRPAAIALLALTPWCLATWVLAAGTNAPARPQLVYPVPITPQFAPGSPFKSLWPEAWLASPTPTPAQTASPSSEERGSASTDRSGAYDSVGEPRRGGGGSTFSSDQEPIVDPSTIPQEVTFDPKGDKTLAP